MRVVLRGSMGVPTGVVKTKPMSPQVGPSCSRAHPPFVARGPEEHPQPVRVAESSAVIEPSWAEELERDVDSLKTALYSKRARCEAEVVPHEA